MIYLASDENLDCENKKFKKKEITEAHLIDFFKKYNVSYTSDIEQLAINLAMRGQEALSQDDPTITEEICSLLSALADQWNDSFIKMKSCLLKAELAGYKNGDKIPHLEKALSYAKKNNLIDVESGVRIQIAFEKFKTREYKRVLKELKIIEKHSEALEDNKHVVLELRARIYWEIDDYIKGFNATYEWYEILKTSLNDLHSLFMTIVYLLTVMKSTPLPLSNEKLAEIKDDITSLLADLATSVHLFSQILPYIDILFAKSLKIVEPDILHNFTDLILQTVRWNDEEKYLYFCQKISDAYYNIDDSEKAVQIMDKALKYTKERKYEKVGRIIQYKKVEFSSLIFYFMNFDALFDPWIIKNVKIRIDEKEQIFYIDPLSSGVNTYPATSYSHLLRILDKASHKYIIENSLELEGLNSDEERGFFVLEIEHAKDRIRILMREDFSVEIKESKTLHSTITPYYSVIGLISDKKSKNVLDIEGIEEVLLRLQRAINCPASTATIYLSKEKPHLNLFKYYLQQGGFRDLRLKIIDTALSLGRKYNFARNDDFLQIFQVDPITIFDLTLRNPQQLQPLTNLVNNAYNLKLTNSLLFEFFEDLMDFFLKRSDTRFWKDFYYEYAWLQTQGVFLSLSNDEIEKKKEILEKIVFFALHIDNPKKILEGLYFKSYISLVKNDNSLKQNNEILKEKSIFYNNTKYELIAKILSQFEKEIDFTDDEKLTEILNLFCELCDFRDWPVSLELFIYLLSKLPQLTTLFEICKKREVKDAGLLLYLHLSNYLMSIERYNEALQLLVFIKRELEGRKKGFFFSEHTWDYIKFQADQYLYDMYDELSSEEREEYQLVKEDILEGIIERDEWISDPIYLVKIIKDYTTILLDKSEFSMGEKYYHWIEQLMFYSWDLFTSDTNASLLQEIKNLKKRIESQHFI